jgi:hypothetical protein
MISTAENVTNRDNVATNWNLGPVKTSIFATENTDYWSKMADIWAVSDVVARTQLCANCEYYDNTSEMMLEMNSIPLDVFDFDGGGRGFCEKFNFICHNLRTCMSWEDESSMDDMQEEAMKMILPQLIKGL